VPCFSAFGGKQLFTKEQTTINQNVSHTNKKATKMDHTKHDSVAKVVAHVVALPHSARRILDVPWRGRRVDETKVQFILDGMTAADAAATNASRKRRRVTPAAVTGTSAAPAAAVTTGTSAAPAAVTVTPAAVTGTSTAPAEVTLPDCHVLTPFSSMVDWITSSMACKHCRTAMEPLLAQQRDNVTVAIQTSAALGRNH
jgi:hypothetical protein